MKPVRVVGKAKRHNHFIHQILGQLLLLRLKEPVTVVKDVMNGRAEVNQLLEVHCNYTIAAVEVLHTQCRIQDVLQILRITLKSDLQLLGSQPNCLLSM